MSDLEESEDVPSSADGPPRKFAPAERIVELNDIDKVYCPALHPLFKLL